MTAPALTLQLDRLQADARMVILRAAWAESLPSASGRGQPR